MASAFKIAIVGSGPAGLSAAARAAQLGLSHVLIEKADHLCDTIYKYQKGKHVMATPDQVKLRSDLDFMAGKRETVLDTWENQSKGHGVQVMLGAEVVAITGSKGDFTLRLQDAAADAGDGAESGPGDSPEGAQQARKGREIKAETIVLAIGTQGNPRQVECPVEEGATVQYTLDDAGAYVDEHITVIGAGDAGIENALGLAEDDEQKNTVTVVNRSDDFATAKGPNISDLMAAKEEKRIKVLMKTKASRIEKGWITFETRDGELRIPCNRVIARMGSDPPRGFVRACCGELIDGTGRKGEPIKVVKPGTGIEFSSEERVSYPKLSSKFESTVPGIYVIGALAGYPLIKHCMNQGYDVVEFINGNDELEPVDEQMLMKLLQVVPGGNKAAERLEFLRSRIGIFEEVSPLQMREFMLDSEVHFFRKDDVIFKRNALEDSLFAIASGSVLVQIDPNDPRKTVSIETGSIFGEVGLISGRRRGATVRAAEDSIVVEIPRTSALKLMSTVPAAKRAIQQISLERQLLQMFRSGLTPDDLKEVLADAEVIEVKAGEAVITEGELGNDIYVVRVGSMAVEKNIGGRPVFLSYLPAAAPTSFFGEMALIDGGPRTATVKAAIKSEVVRLKADAFTRLLANNPELDARFREIMETRREINDIRQAKRASDVVDVNTAVAKFLLDRGLGEATDVLLIDEKLCVGCDNCERACADAHEGLSRLNREAGASYAHLHVPTSCRHCEHPHCMADCPPNAIERGPHGEVFIKDNCIGCGNCQRSCPYGVIRMEKVPPKKPNLLKWLFFGEGPGPGEPSHEWSEANMPHTGDPKIDQERNRKKAVKCDMCAGIDGGPACVRACPTGAAIRVAPEEFLSITRMAG